MPSAARWVRALDTRRLGSYLYLGVCDRRPPRPVEGSLFEDACFRLLGFPKAVCPDNPFIRGARLDGSGVASMAGEELILATVLAIILVLVILRAAVKVVREYERLVIFRLGRLLSQPKGPGLTVIIPIFDRRVLIDLRTVAFDVPRQRVVSRDNVSVEVDAVVYYRVYDPLKAVTEVQNYVMATNLLAQTTLRDVLGQVELDELLSKREELSKRIQVLLDISTEPWGIKVQAVTLRDVSMAEGEFQAAEKMREAAMLYGSAPSAMRLRELQTLTEIAREKNMIVVTNTTAAGDITGEVASLTAALARKGDKKE